MRVKRTLTIYIAQATSVFSSLALSFLLINTSQKELVGQFLYFMTINTIAINLLTSPLGMWLTRLGGEGDNDHEIRAVMQLWTQLGLFLALASVALFVSGYHYPGIAALYIAAGVICSSYTYEWNSSDSYVLYSLGTSFVSITRLAAVVISLFYWPQSATAETAATVSYLIAFVAMIWMSKLQAAKVLPRSILGGWRAVNIASGWRLAISMTASSLIFSGYQTLDKTLTKSLFGPEKVAELITTQQWSYTIVTTALQPFIAMIYPAILQGKANAFDLARVRFRHQILIVFVLFIGCYILQLIAIQLIPTSYVSNVWWLWTGMISGILFMAGQIASISFSRDGRETKHVISVMVPTVIVVPAMYVFIQRFGVAGALAAGCLFNLIYFTTCIKLSLKKK